MMVPKMIKNAGWLGLGLVAWSMWKAGVLVPYFNDYKPEAFAAEMDSAGAKPELIVAVDIDPYKLAGTPFDGADIGGVFGPVFATGGFSSPPDPTLCIVTLENKRPSCLLKPRAGEATSYCVNAYACEWSLSYPAGRAFALVMFDVDNGVMGGSWDYIDAALILDHPSQSEFDALNARLDLFVSYVAPTHIDIPNGSGTWRIDYDKEERYRREKPLPFYTPDEIIQPDGVRLVQSGLRIAIIN